MNTAETYLALVRAFLFLAPLSASSVGIAQWAFPLSLRLRLATFLLSLSLLPCVLFQVLALFGAFRFFPALVLTWGLAFAFWRLGARPRFALLQGDFQKLRKNFSIPNFFLLVFAVFLFRVTLRGPHGWDALTYHYAKAALWVQSGGLSLFKAPGGWSIYRHYPAGASILPAWALLLAGSDLFCGWLDFALWIAMGIAFGCLVRGWGTSIRSTLARSIYILSLPVLAKLVGSGMTESSLCLALILSWVFADAHFKKGGLLALCLSLLAAGMAVGMKVTALPNFAALALLFVVSGKTKTIPVLIALALGLLPAVLWFAWNFKETGYPLFPLNIKLGEWVLGIPNAQMNWFQSRTISAQWRGELPAFLHLFRAPWDLGQHFGWFTLLLVGGGIFGLFRLCREQFSRGVAFLLLLCGVTFSYFSSDMAMLRMHWPETSSRFVLPTIVLLVALCRVPASWDARFNKVLFGLAFLQLSARAGAHWIAIEAIGIPVGIAIGLFLHWKPLPRKVAWMIVLLALPTGSLLRERGRWSSYWSRAKEGVPVYWTAIAQKLDGPVPKKIAVTSGPWQNSDNWFLYPLMGSHLQNTLTYVPFHEEGWYAGLKKVAVQYVVSFQPASAELQWMEQHPKLFVRIEGDGASWGCYHVQEDRHVAMLSQ